MTDTFNRDQEDLRLLVGFHYIFGGITALFSCIPLLFTALGLWLASMPPGSLNCTSGNMPSECPPPFVGWLFAAFGLMFSLVGWTFSAIMILNGRFMARRKAWMACLFLSGAECFITPFGTVLGVLSLMVLARPSVKEAFLPLPAQANQLPTVPE